MSADTIAAIEAAVQAHVDSMNIEEGDVPGYVTGCVVVLEESAINADGKAIYGNRYITGQSTTINTATGLLDWAENQLWADAHGDRDD